MSKQFNIITGLPRSGSTLLCNILNQNPKFHASETSALVRILTAVKAGWENFPENMAVDNMDRKINVLRGIVDSYYQDKDSDELEIIFDKNRAWLNEPELAKLLFGDNFRMIVCVRNLVDIVASFEKLFRSNNSVFDIQDKKNFDMSTTSKRAEVWCSEKGPIGSTVISLQELQLRLRKKHIYIIEFDELVNDPKTVLDELYDELHIEKFEHNFQDVQVATRIEDDRFHGILGLHKINSIVKPPINTSRAVLGEEVFAKWSGGNFWKK